MKKVFFLIASALCIVSANAQCDPSFTDKIINTATKAELYFEANEAGKEQALTNLVNSFLAFYPMTAAEFEEKQSCMLNNPTEMAKVPTNLVGFVGCIASANSFFYSCVRPPSLELSNFQPRRSCIDTYAFLVHYCAEQYLL